MCGFTENAALCKHKAQSNKYFCVLREAREAERAERTERLSAS